MPGRGQEAEKFSMFLYGHLKELGRLSAVVASQGEDGILSCLHAAGRELLSGELVARTGLTTGRIANILGQLEHKQMIERVQDGDDRRCVHVRLTQAGLKRAEALSAQSVSTIAKLFEHLGEKDSRELMRLSERCFSFIHES